MNKNYIDMSFFRTLQNQPRIITLFTDTLQHRPNQKILDSLKAHATGKYKLELAHSFPTLDQLQYMQSVNPTLLAQQVPNVKSLLSKPSHDPLFHSQLDDCVKQGYWKPSSSLWVDWEKQRMGNDATE